MRDGFIILPSQFRYISFLFYYFNKYCNCHHVFQRRSEPTLIGKGVFQRCRAGLKGEVSREFGLFIVKNDVITPSLSYKMILEDQEINWKGQLRHYLI